MEKAMEKSHGMSFAEYERTLANRMKVEKKRELDYAKSKEILTTVKSHLHR
ncbi:hypothetical protein GCM10010978_22660 [Compostibacillus humi]|jgi:hypothetical protein|uniref:Uncharacterized protein n=1 Tax=Compostibacillus humi TaxID=1245525 RepID=A0A8J2TTK6_9BACI|nr:hypothetical protein [Compostibacillus humi]GFZ81135.1 hypothetical protein GCM10010978_22660 [Compostibacillus humi]